MQAGSRPETSFLRRTFRLSMAVPAAVAALCATASANVPGGGRSLMELFEATGLVGWLILFTSIGGVALLIEHCVNLRRDKLAPPEMVDELEALIEEKSYDEAIELCDAEKNYLGTLVGAGLRMRHAGYEHMVVGLEQAAAEETFKLQAHISLLSLLGNIGPLLGLLGTVTGMISSFQAIEKLKAPTPGDLAVGVYESLVNTTMGLFVAVVFLTCYFFFKNKVTKMTLSINLQAVDMLKGFAGKEHARAAA
jgi:biopolymer transport protein ExbB